MAFPFGGQYSEGFSPAPTTPQSQQHEGFPEWNSQQAQLHQDVPGSQEEYSQSQQQPSSMDLAQPHHLVPSQGGQTPPGHDRSPIKLHSVEAASPSEGQLHREGTLIGSSAVPQRPHGGLQVETDSGALLSTVVGSSSAVPSPAAGLSSSLVDRRAPAVKQHRREQQPYSRPQTSQPGQARGSASSSARSQEKRRADPDPVPPTVQSRQAYSSSAPAPAVSYTYPPPQRQQSYEFVFEPQQHNVSQGSASSARQPSIPGPSDERRLPPTSQNTHSAGAGVFPTASHHFGQPVSTAAAAPSLPPPTLHKMYFAADMHYDPNRHVMIAVLECPGIHPDNLRVSVSTCLYNHVRQLVVSGTSMPPYPVSSTGQAAGGSSQGPTIICRERKYGELHRVFPVHIWTSARDVHATLRYGILELAVQFPEPLTSSSEEVVPIQVLS